MAAPGVALLGDVAMALPARLLDYQPAHQLGRRTRDEINAMADCLEGAPAREKVQKILLWLMRYPESLMEARAIVARRVARRERNPANQQRRDRNNIAARERRARLTAHQHFEVNERRRIADRARRAARAAARGAARRAAAAAEQHSSRDSDSSD